MRVRITRPRQGEIDGVDLSQLENGIVYNLPTTLASYLVLTQSAEGVDDSAPDRPDTMLFRGVPTPPDVADDCGLDEAFIEIFDHVCGVTPTVRDITPKLANEARQPLPDTDAVAQLRALHNSGSKSGGNRRRRGRDSRQGQRR